MKGADEKRRPERSSAKLWGCKTKKLKRNIENKETKN